MLPSSRKCSQRRWLLLCLSGVRDFKPHDLNLLAASHHDFMAHVEPTGVTSCSFNTYGQCMQTVSGIGGYCYRNPSYGHVRRH